MTFARRLATLESGLSPREAVLRWLAEVRAFPSLSAYVTWLIDQPSEAWPLVAIPAQLERGVRASMHGQARPEVERAIGRAVAQALFLVELVLLANRRVATLTRELACGVLAGASTETADRGRALDAALDRLGARYFGDGEAILLDDVARDWHAVLVLRVISSLTWCGMMAACSHPRSPSATRIA